jgi:hypothetical protein
MQAFQSFPLYLNIYNHEMLVYMLKLLIKEEDTVILLRDTEFFAFGNYKQYLRCFNTVKGIYDIFIG